MAGAERAAGARQGAAESEEERERVGPPLGEQPPNRGYICGTERTRGEEEAPGRDTGDLGEGVAEQQSAGGGPAVGSAGRKREEEVAGGRGGECRGRRRRGQRTRRAKEPAAKTTWEWILLTLCLWSALRVGAALVLKGNRVKGEVFAFDALWCDN